jgi:hypothetical protein
MDGVLVPLRISAVLRDSALDELTRGVRFQLLRGVIRLFGPLFVNQVDATPVEHNELSILACQLRPARPIQNAA